MATKWKNLIYLLVALLTLSIALAITWFYVYRGENANHVADRQTQLTAPHYNLRLGLNLSADSALHAAAKRFAALVAERSDGQVDVILFPDQILGTDQQMIEMAREGKLDLLLTPTAKLSVDVPAMQYADLPFYFADRTELYTMLDGEPGHLLLNKLYDIGLVGIAFWENGFKQFTANRPIHHPKDFAGLRIRTMKSRLLMDQFSMMGAEPVVIDFATLHQALADGAVDGQENPLVAIAGKHLYEVQKYLTLSNHAWLGYVFSASRQTFENLPQDIRNIIVDTANELTTWEREETARRERKFLETIKASGVEIIELSEQERQQFANTLAPIVRSYGFEIGYDLIAKTEELRTLALLDKAKQNNRPNSSLPWLIGLDADLSSSGFIGGGAILRGMEMAAEEINAKGGISGHPIRIVARDHRQHPLKGIENIKALAQLPGMLAIMGGMHSAVIVDELEEVHQLKIPFLLPWSASSGTVHHDYRPSYTFRLSIDDTWVIPFLLEHARHRNHHIAALLEQSVWGRSNEHALKPLIAKLPPGTVTLEWINRGETDFSSRLIDLQNNGIEALLLVATAPESQAVINAMAQMEKPMPIYAHWGLTGGDFWQQSKEALKKVDLRLVQSVLIENNKAHPRLQAFGERYRARYRLTPIDPIPAPVGTAHAYELFHLFASAVQQAKSSDHEMIRTTLENLRVYSGIIRDYKPPFTADRHDALGPEVLHMAHYDRWGRIVAAP